MLKKIGLGVLALVALFLIAAANRPDTFRIERSVTIAAPAEVVFAQINDLHQWSNWNPFQKSDPGITMSYEGAPSGVGSSFHYVGKQAGEGRMTITQVTPNERVAVKGEFIKPFAATNDIEFTLTPTVEGVSVTWAMSGDNTFIGKAISLFIDTDKMIGGEFEKGLVDLKRVSEETAARLARPLEPASATSLAAAE